MATVKTPTRRAKHVKLVQIVYYYCWLASSDNLLQCTYNYVFEKYFFASSHHSLREATRKPFINLVSLSQAYHFITYNRSSTHNDNEDTRWIIDHFQQNILVKFFSHNKNKAMKWTSAQPLVGVGNACFEPQVILWEGPAIVNLEANAGLII